MPLFPRAKFEIHADDKSRRGVNSARSNLDKLRKQVSLTGVATVAAAGVGGLGLLTAAGIKLGDELAKTSDKLGLSTEGLAGLRNAARLTGVETNKLDLGLQRMTRRVAEAAQGTGEAQNALKELGLDARELAAQSPDEQFRSIAEAMKGVSSQSDRVRLGFKLFDSEGVDLIRTLDLGADGLDAAAREAERFGTAISRVQAREIEMAGDAIGRVRTATEGLSTQLAASLGPSIASAANEFADWIAFITTTGIPAFRLLGERIGLVELNIRALSEQELLVRVESLTDRMNDLQGELSKTGLPSDFTVQLNLQLAETKQQLDDVNARLGVFRREREAANDPVQEISLESLPKRRAEVNEEYTEALFKRAAARRAAAERKAAEEQERRDQESAARRAEREAQYRQGELDATREFLKSREEIELEAFERRNQIILENMEAGAERDELLLKNAQDRADALVEIERYKEEEITRAIEAGNYTREQIEQLSARKKTQVALGELSKLTAGVATHNRAMFELNKAAAIAEGILGAREAVLGAYKVGAKIGGPVLGGIFAATAAAATAAQISAIASTSFGSGSTPSVVGTVPTLDRQPVPQSTASTQSPAPAESNVIQVTVYGDILTEDRLESVLANMFAKDRVIIQSNHRQAAEIRG